MIGIGYGSFLNEGRIVAVLQPDSAPIKRMVQEGRDRGAVIDASYGRKTAAVFVMDSGHIVLSALPPERFGGQDNQEITGQEEKGEPA